MLSTYDFDNVDTEAYSLPHDIGGQAALNDLNRQMFNMFCGFKDEDEAWADMRRSDFGAKLYELFMEFDEFEFNGTANEDDQDE